MKRSFLLTAASCAALALPALAIPTLLEEFSLTSTPKEGTTLTKTYTTEIVMELVDSDLQVLVNGEEQEMDNEEMELTTTQGETTTVVETITGMDGDRVTGVSRVYKSVEGNSGQSFTGPDGESMDDETEKESHLDGKTIEFKWDGEQDEWTAAWGEDEEGEAEHLEDLEGDSGFGWMLPGEAVEVGDSWELDLDAFVRTMDPFGDMHWDDDDVDQDDFNTAFEEGLEVASFTATLKGVEDGIATIALEIEAGTSFMIEPDLGDEVPDGFEMTNDFEFSFELEGTLTWNLEANHAVSLEIEGDMAMEMTMEQAASGEMEFEVTQLQSFEGSTTITFTVE